MILMCPHNRHSFYCTRTSFWNGGLVTTAGVSMPFPEACSDNDWWPSVISNSSFADTNSDSGAAVGSEVIEIITQVMQWLHILSHWCKLQLLSLPLCLQVDNHHNNNDQALYKKATVALLLHYLLLQLGSALKTLVVGIRSIRGWAECEA